MLAFWECWAKAKGDQTQIHQFLQANLDQLNESLLEALPLVFTAMTKEQSATAIATLFVAFGNATWQFPLGDRWLNLELSIASYQLSLKVFTRLAFPENWATSQNDLGVVYRDRIRGERAENLEQAIAHLENALQVYKREIYQKEWAAIQNNFGLVYSVRIRGNRAENLEKAITAYENALQIYAYDTLPNDWAGTQNNLGNA